MWGTLLLFFGTLAAIQTSPNAVSKPCSKDDKECLLKVFDVLYKEVITGDPALDIEPLEPTYHKEIVGDVATLKYKLVNTTIKGFKDCNVVDAGVSKDEDSMHMELNCPFFHVSGLYESDGEILTLPIKGKGDYAMEFKDYQIVLDSEIKVTEKDGKKFVTIKSYKYSTDLKSGTVDLKNLFNGENKELADTVLKVMNENWVTLAKDFQEPVVKVNFEKIVKNFNKLFKFKDISTLIS